MRGPAGLVHLTRRFVGSLWPGGPSAADAAWAESRLLSGEVALWRRMPAADRRHAVGVARDVTARLGPAAGRPVLAAALLHDVGKLESGFGTFGRVFATVVAGVRGRATVAGWSGEPGLRGRLGRYVLHPELGGRLLTDAGADPLTVAWAREHHLPPEAWTVPGPLAAALKAADDD